MFIFKNIINRYKNNYFSKVILSILTIWLLGSLIISIIEPGSFQNIANSLWWSIVTMTTVGYGDMAPVTVPGRLLAIIIMLSGIILVAIITASISSKFVTKKIMEGKGLEKIKLTNHILICGWNTNIRDLINGLLISSKVNDIVLINDQHQDEIDNLMSYFSNYSIKFVRGDYSNDAILEKANILKAKYVLILNGINSNEDEKVILTSLTIKKLSNNIKVIAQINDKSKIPFLKRANADAVLSGHNYNSFMAISNILDPSIAQTINEIIDTSSNTFIHSVNIPDEFIGKSYLELHTYFLNENESTCLGIYNREENMGISDILSSDNSALDKFIEKKLKEAGHSLNENDKININLNPKKDEIIQKGQGAILLK